MFYNTVTTDLKPIDYFHRLVKLYCDKESNRVQYLLCCLNALIMVATVNLLRFGRTLSPASAIVMPWTMTWSMTVARISSVMMVQGCLALPPGPSPLPCWPPPLPCWPPPLLPWPALLPPLTQIPLPLTLPSSIVFVWNLQQTVHSELAFIHVVTALATSVFNFESLCVMNDARCVHCVQILLTVASILHHMSFHLRIWAELFCNLCFSKEKCVKIYENGGLCFVNCVFMWNVFMILENDG